MCKEKKFKRISELMTAEVITIPEYEPLCNFERYFKKRSIHHLIVLNLLGEVTGVISESDVAQIKSWVFDNKVEAKDLMSSKPITIKPEDTAISAITIFLENKIRALPVVSSTGKLRGIITPYDIMKDFAES